MLLAPFEATRYVLRRTASRSSCGGGLPAAATGGVRRATVSAATAAARTGERTKRHPPRAVERLVRVGRAGQRLRSSGGRPRDRCCRNLLGGAAQVALAVRQVPAVPPVPTNETARQTRGLDLEVALRSGVIDQQTIRPGNAGPSTVPTRRSENAPRPPSGHSGRCTPASRGDLIAVWRRPQHDSLMRRPALRARTNRERPGSSAAPMHASNSASASRQAPRLRDSTRLIGGVVPWAAQRCLSTPHSARDHRKIVPRRRDNRTDRRCVHIPSPCTDHNTKPPAQTGRDPLGGSGLRRGKRR